MILDALSYVQLAFSCALLFAIAERIYYLCYLAPISRVGGEWVKAQLQSSGHGAVIAWARRAPHTHVARLIRVAFESDCSEEAIGEEQSELAELVGRRLRFVRVGATLASTSGLLVGILRFREGSLAPAGLLALERGLPERIATSQALFAMAIGISTSAVCFYALSSLRRSAVQLLSQSALYAGLLIRSARRDR